VVLALNALAEFVQLPNRCNQRAIVDAGLVGRLTFLLDFGRWDAKPDDMLPPHDLPKSLVQSLKQRRSSVTSVKSVKSDSDAEPDDLLSAPICEKNVAQPGFEQDILDMKGAAVTVLLGLLECVDDAYIPGSADCFVFPPLACSDRLSAF
jgi:hypothetical protein